MREDFKLELKIEHVQGEKDITFYRYMRRIIQKNGWREV